MKRVSKDLLSKFAKVIVQTGSEKKKQNIGLYGTVVVDEETNQKYVQLDGAPNRTPIYEAMDARNGDRIIASIKDHKLVLTGNLTAPASARSATDLSKPINVGSMIGNLTDEGEPQGAYIIFQEDRALICLKNEEVDSIVIGEFSLEGLRIKKDLGSTSGELNLKVADISKLTINKIPFMDYVSGGNFELPAATADQLGGVKIGYQKNERKFPVELNDENRMYVEVPETEINLDQNDLSGNARIPSGTSITFVNHTFFGGVYIINANTVCNAKGDYAMVASFVLSKGHNVTVRGRARDGGGLFISKIVDARKESIVVDFKVYNGFPSEQAYSYNLQYAKIA